MMKEKRHDTIKVHDLVTGYKVRGGYVKISTGFDAVLMSGELTCLLGPNGAGKSTLLRTLSAFQPPVSGEIEIEGKPLKSYSDTQLSRVLGVVLTERVSLANMTVEELVGLGRSPYTGFWGTLSSHDKEVVEKSIAHVKIEGLRDRMVNTLSDGERQKVMIAKALAQETPVIFLDEPTAFLDYPSKVEIMQLLYRLAHEQDKTVFMSTHDMELALQIADKLWLLDRKAGVRIGTPEDLSLSGDMARYFEREGVEFDPVNGLFRIKNHATRKVRVSGDGAACNMLRKALLRNGIQSVEADEPACEVEIIVTPEPAYMVNGEKLDTIGEVLEHVV
ncbi:MAG: ABC transporter ATP-binding protein [Muribaculaceae bacterium]|nr:ABC transporter ATP-binding protein [Muribaculaceae bacterium]